MSDVLSYGGGGGCSSRAKEGGTGKGTSAETGPPSHSGPREERAGGTGAGARLRPLHLALPSAPLALALRNLIACMHRVHVCLLPPHEWQTGAHRESLMRTNKPQIRHQRNGECKSPT